MNRVEAVLLDYFDRYLVGFPSRRIPNRDEGVALARRGFRVQDATLSAALVAESARCCPEERANLVLPDELLLRMQAYGGSKGQLPLLLESDRKVQRANYVLSDEGLVGARAQALRERTDGIETLLLMRQNGFGGIEVGLVYDPHMPGRKSHASVLLVNAVFGTKHRVAYYDFLDILTETGLGGPEGPVGGWDFESLGGINLLYTSRRDLLKGE